MSSGFYIAIATTFYLQNNWDIQIVSEYKQTNQQAIYFSVLRNCNDRLLRFFFVQLCVMLTEKLKRLLRIIVYKISIGSVI